MAKKPPPTEIPESLREIYAQLDGKPAPEVAAAPAPAVDGSLKDIYASLGMKGEFEEEQAAPASQPIVPVVFESLKGIYSDLGIDGKSVEKPVQPVEPPPRKQEIEDEQLRRMLGDATRNSFDVMGSGADPDIVDARPHRNHLVSGPGSVQFEDERPRRGSFRDDWDVEVEQYEKASVGPRGEQLDDFDQLTQVRQAQKEALQQVAPTVSTAPPSAAGAVLGNILLVQPNGVPVQLMQWQGNDDTETCAVLITISPIDNLPTTQAVNALEYRPQGIITWGTHGSAHTAQFDIAAGARFVVNGSAVSVSIVLNQGGVGNIPLTAPLKFTGSMSFNPSLGSVLPPTCTVVVDINAGGFTQIPLPAFAKTVTVWRSNANQSLALEFQNYNQLGAAGFDYPANGTGGRETVVPQPLLIPGNVAYVQLHNTGASPGEFYVVFTLEF